MKSKNKIFYSINKKDAENLFGSKDGYRVEF